MQNILLKSYHERMMKAMKINLNSSSPDQDDVVEMVEQMANEIVSFENCIDELRNENQSLQQEIKELKDRIAELEGEE